MIKVYNAENLNREAVVDLWVRSFGDSNEYVEFFLDNCPSYICIEYFIDHKLVAMLFLLEGELFGEKSKYLYAACTDADYRRRGIMEELISFSKCYCKDKGFSSIFLVPASDSLYSYYAKFGFIASFNKKFMCVKSANIINDEFESVDIDRILSVKKKLLKSIKGFIFNDEVMKYTVKEHLFNGGRIFLKNIEDKYILIFYYLNNSDLIIKELLTDFDDISTVLNEHFGNKNAENIYICTPLVYNNRDIVEEYAKCGMCFPIDKKTSEYLNDRSDLYAGMYLD